MTRPIALAQRLAFAAGLATGCASIAAAQTDPTVRATHVVIITGLSAEPDFAREFATVARTLYDTAQRRWGVRNADLVYLAENPASDSIRVDGRSTRADIAAVFAGLAHRVHHGDIILILLLGHGSGERGASAVNLPGPDATADDYARWLTPLDSATVVFVNASSASGDFADALAGSHRVIVTATQSALERNRSIFAPLFVAGLTGSAGDADKDGEVSVGEAFAFALGQVASAYQHQQELQTEHARLVDASGIAAHLEFATGIGVDASTDPRVARLIARRRTLETAVDSLRRRKASMDSTSYQTALETLLLQVARHTEAIDSLRHRSDSTAAPQTGGGAKRGPEPPP